MSKTPIDINIQNGIENMEMPIPVLHQPRMFYYQCKTSQDLCKLGLFTLARTSSSNKHRRLICSFCHQEMSGWREKFCNHLDKCEYAQNYFNSHPENTEIALLNRHNKRLSVKATSLKDSGVHSTSTAPLIPFDRAQYLSMLVAGYVCSTGISKRTIENDFMKNLAFTLHWQFPSSYIIQKNIEEVNQKLNNTAMAIFKEETSSTLIVYPWIDVNKKCTLSYILYSPNNFVYFYDSFLCKQDEWTAKFITDQTNSVLANLFQQGVHISMILYQDNSFYKDLRDEFFQSENYGVIPYQLDCVCLCEYIMTAVFTHQFFSDLRDIVSSGFQTITSTSSIRKIFNDRCLQAGFTNITIPTSNEEQWSSLFNIFSFFINYFDIIQETVGQAINENIISNQHLLCRIQQDDGLLNKLRLVTFHFKDIVDCTDPNSPTNKDMYSVILAIRHCLATTKDYYSIPEVIQHVENILSVLLSYRHDEDLMCLYATFAQQYTPQDLIALQSNPDRQSSIMQSLHRINYAGIDVLSELNMYLSASNHQLEGHSAGDYWKNIAPLQYPNLSKVLSPLFAIPSTPEQFQILKNMKIYIHSYYRNHKDGQQMQSHGREEMLISCNRHILLRWDLDFQ